MPLTLGLGCRHHFYTNLYAEPKWPNPVIKVVFEFDLDEGKPTVDIKAVYNANDPNAPPLPDEVELHEGLASEIKDYITQEWHDEPYVLKVPIK